MINTLIQLSGWVGTALFIFSYVQLNRGLWTVRTLKYHVYNILGSVFLVINTVYDYSYAAAMANLFWGVVACYGLIRYRRQYRAMTTRQKAVYGADAKSGYYLADPPRP